MLGCQLGADGRIHARYPTGLRTLCGLEADELASSAPPPSCSTCLNVGRQFGLIDGSCPELWLVELPAVPAHLHGTSHGYNTRRCRCVLCVEARRAYDRERYARKRAERLAA